MQIRNLLTTAWKLHLKSHREVGHTVRTGADR